MSSYPIPNFQNFHKFQSLSTKKERKANFSNFGPPPKAPVRSCPVTRVYPAFKEDTPKAVSFRENPDNSFIFDNPLYSTNKGTYFEQCYTIEKRLGKGSFGEVFKVISKKEGLSYACKRTLLKYRGEMDRYRRIQEVKKHELLTPHINCVKFYRAWEEDNHLYMLTEVCKCSLADILLNIHEFPESQLWSFLVDILQGLHHLHMNYLMHMDVKPDNIFMGENGHCKLGDFGLVIDFSGGFPSEAVEGDPKYLAPECLQNIYTPAADIFSLGMVMLEIATDLFLPHRGPEWHELRNGNIPSMDDRGLSSEFQILVKRFLEPDPKQRLSSTEALNYPKVKYVICKKKWISYLSTKVQKIKGYFNAVLLFPLMLFSVLSSFVRNRVIEYKGMGWNVSRDSISSPIKLTPVRSACIDGPNDSGDEILEKSVGECTSNFAYMDHIVNSTPISHSKRREIFPQQDISRLRSGEDLMDGKRFSFNESSFSSLESSQENLPELLKKDESKEETRAALNVTARNLLELFNSAESSDEDNL